MVNKTSEGLDLEGSKRALVDRAVGAWTCVKEEKESNSFHSSSLIPLSDFLNLFIESPINQTSWRRQATSQKG
uniref:Uncharacterized protein n=1 Tax=Utricularia reniformis TaxID=192314 RepID=A0A1Y0AYW4_9LAMI|nr:hypothetical protein AEK19_MT1142 [Utricularia reniformis]ART30352.1 hypothetical protein AEK19_MT1142 [Utricularia reniformis]